MQCMGRLRDAHIRAFTSLSVTEGGRPARFHAFANGPNGGAKCEKTARGCARSAAECVIRVGVPIAGKTCARAVGCSAFPRADIQPIHISQVARTTRGRSTTGRRTVQPGLNHAAALDRRAAPACNSGVIGTMGARPFIGFCVVGSTRGLWLCGTLGRSGHQIVSGHSLSVGQLGHPSSGVVNPSRVPPVRRCQSTASQL